MQHDLGAGDGLVDTADLGEVVAGGKPGLRVVDHHLGAGGVQLVGHGERGGVPGVVGAGFEGRAEHGDPDPGDVAAELLDGQLGELGALARVDRLDRLDQLGQDTDLQLLGANGQRPDVLRQAAAAETESGVQELPTDPLVVAEGIGQQHHVAPGGLAHLGHRVDEADLGGQERVRRGLDQLGGGEVAADHGGRLGERDGVHLLEHLQGPGALHPEHEAVRAEGVLDGETLAQELGVPGDLDAVTGRRQGAQPLLELQGRADRDGRLADHQGRSGEQRRQAVDRRLQLAQIGGTVGTGRSAQGQEVHVGPVGDHPVVGGEAEPTGTGVPGQQRFQTDLEDGGAAGGQDGDPLGVDVDPHHLVPDLGHARRMGGPEVAGADDTHPQSHRPTLSPSRVPSVRRSRAAAAGDGPCAGPRARTAAARPPACPAPAPWPAGRPRPCRGPTWSAGGRPARRC